MLGATLTVKFSMSDLCRESSCVSKLVLDFNTRFIDGCLWSDLHRQSRASRVFIPVIALRGKEGKKNNEKVAARPCRQDHKHHPLTWVVFFDSLESAKSSCTC